MKYYHGHKFLSINFPSKRRGRARRAGEGGVYKLKAAFGNSSQHFLPAQWLPQYAICAEWVDDFLHKL